MTPTERLHELRKAFLAINPDHFRWHLWLRREPDCGTFCCVIGAGMLWPALRAEGLGVVPFTDKYADDGAELCLPGWPEPYADDRQHDFFGIKYQEYEALVNGCYVEAWEAGLIDEDEHDRWEEGEPFTDYDWAWTLLDRLCARYPLPAPSA